MEYGQVHTTTKMRIELLPEHLIDQIKAGEVIERPSALLKEIIENSVDSGASFINIHLINNGMDLISIIDDGCGMSFEELPYAFCRHATSKIKNFEDLYHLNTFGFRGEALASIASISRITCSSYPKNGTGGKIIIHGGQTLSHVKLSGSGQGTSLFIKDLFYNTPARLKFNKSQAAEKNAILKILQSFLLVRPNIKFSISWDEKDKEIFTPVEVSQWKKRVFKVFSISKQLEDIVEIDQEYREYQVKVFFTKNATKGNSKKIQFLFVNNRYFIDKSLHQMIVGNLSEIWGPGVSGEYCIFINSPKDQLDVNVHPNKIHVKFTDYGLVYQLISTTLKKNIRVNPNPAPSVKNESFQEKIQLDENIQLAEQIDLLNDKFFKNTTIKEQIDIIKIGEHYVLYKEKYLISLQNLIEHQLHNIFSVDEIADENIVPLLISAPLKLMLKNTKEILPWIEKKGLEIDQLSNSLYALRTVPKGLETLDIDNFLVTLLLEIDKNPLANISKIKTIIKKIKATFPKNFSLTKDLLDQALNLSECTILLDDELLGTLFK